MKSCISSPVPVTDGSCSSSASTDSSAISLLKVEKANEKLMTEREGKSNYPMS